MSKLLFVSVVEVRRADTMAQYIYRTSTYYLSLHDLWKEWPNREMDGLMKAYTLAQLSFYLQLLIVINIEERRKDHWQMFSHHIVTSTLIYAAYREGHTRVGNLILVLMDVVDIFLPVCVVVTPRHPLIMF